MLALRLSGKRDYYARHLLAPRRKRSYVIPPDPADRHAFWASRGPAEEAHPETNLLRRVLVDAVDVVQKAEALWPWPRHFAWDLAAELEWFRSPEERRLYSFRNILRVLGWDGDVVLRSLTPRLDALEVKLRAMQREGQFTRLYVISSNASKRRAAGID